MAYQEWGSGPSHFDWKNYQMWQRRMAAFLRGKGHILWDVTVNRTYVHSINFLAPGLRDMGTHGSPLTRVPEVPIKWTQPARSPADMQVGPETLSLTPATLEDLGRPHPDFGRPAGLVAQASSLDRGAEPPIGSRIARSSL
jgi:hypothetical protein